MAFCHLSDKILAHIVTSGDEMSLQKQELTSVIPDLRELPLERLALLGDSVRAGSIALYH
jgi:hypothetical protein